MRWGSLGNRYTRGWKRKQGIYVHFLGVNEMGQRLYYVGQTVDYDARYTHKQRQAWVLEDFFEVSDRKLLTHVETIVMRWIERKGGVLVNKHQHRKMRPVPAML